MHKSEDFLVEIHTEELPPKALSRLARHFLSGIEERLNKAQLSYQSATWYATPRRLAVYVHSLASQQADASVERRGPALEAAFNADGVATPACVGFARSCGVTPEQLNQITTPQGVWMAYVQTVAGKSAQALLPTIVQESLANLPIPKRMRWGSSDIEFVRPVLSVILMYGNHVIDAEILGVATGCETQGHRFHSDKPIRINSPATYVEQLEQSGHVLADFEKRKALIRANTEALVKKTLGDKAHALIDDNLLDEVTGLVEWPVAILGNFDPRFLDVPSEALISAMQDHQRYFPIVTQEGKLLPHFITTSNIESKDAKRVVAGNERVIQARLSDAAFFYETDKKISLKDRVENLKSIVFQAKLGTLFDKAKRVETLSGFIAKAMNDLKLKIELLEDVEDNKVNTKAGNHYKLPVGTSFKDYLRDKNKFLSPDISDAKHAGLLAKTDLTTQMVSEFPELQGIAGYYYARNDNEPEKISLAMKEHYMPRFSGDALPETNIGVVVALADRLDTLVGVFGINQQPTGDKDPFALRRAALGILRILIEKQIDLDLRALVEFAKNTYEMPLENKDVVEQVLNFLQERLKPWYQEQNINADVYAAVAALGITRPYDFHLRVQAVQSFKALPDAESLCVANKRVSNILAKVEGQMSATSIDPKLFETLAENTLAEQLDKQSRAITPLFKEALYVDVLTQLSHLRLPVDEFFDKVMVMAEDKAQRENRLLLLTKLRALFLQVADVALLQTR